MEDTWELKAEAAALDLGVESQETSGKRGGSAETWETSRVNQIKEAGLGRRSQVDRAALLGSEGKRRGGLWRGGGPCRQRVRTGR